MLEHLTASFEDGGHGFPEDSYPIAWFDWDDLHANDHDPTAWWAAAIIHAHEDEPNA